MAKLLTKQPLKGLYTVYFVASTLIQWPFLYIYYLPRSLRQHRDYSIQAAIFTKITYELFVFYSRIEIQPDVSLEPRNQGDQFVKIEPASGADENVYTEICLANKRISPTAVGAVWYPDPIPHKETLKDSRVILHFHAGAYVIMSAREYGPAAACLRERFKCPVLSVEYRLASMRDGGGEFPAQLQDAVTAYRYLLRELNINPSSIILCGDSAGAHLVIMFLRYIVSNPSTQLPLPAATMLFSPWINLDDDPEIAALEKNNTHSDLLPDEIFTWALRVFPGPTSRSNEYLSPLRAPFVTSIPIWLCRTPTERVAIGVERFASAMEKAGNKVKLYDTPNFPHDVLFTADPIGQLSIVRAALEDAHLFFETHGVL